MAQSGMGQGARADALGDPEEEDDEHDEHDEHDEEETDADHGDAAEHEDEDEGGEEHDVGGANDRVEGNGKITGRDRDGDAQATELDEDDIPPIEKRAGDMSIAQIEAAEKRGKSLRESVY